MPDWVFELEGIDPGWDEYIAENPDNGDFYESYTELIGDWKQDSEGLYCEDREGTEGFTAIWSKDSGNIIQVVWSKTIKRVASMCSPCYPGQADLDSGEGDILAYSLPSE